MREIPELPKDKINDWFKLNEQPFYRPTVPEVTKPFSESTLLNGLDQTLTPRFCVVGFDVYRYSKFGSLTQPFVPIVVHKMLDYSWHLVSQNARYLFQVAPDNSDTIRFPNRLKERFIDTGDGGFLILDTPLHAIAFIVMFSTVLRMYNSYHFLQQLRQHLGEISIRFAATYDNVHRIGKNYYGPAIIRAARLMSRDRLNRFLIDQHAHEWFLRYLGGIENLLVLENETLTVIPEFSDYDRSGIKSDVGIFGGLRRTMGPVEGIQSVDVQKLGNMKAKEDDIDAYNVHMQAIVNFKGFLQDKSTVYAVVVGNLSTAGLSE